VPSRTVVPYSIVYRQCTASFPLPATSTVAEKGELPELPSGITDHRDAFVALETSPGAPLWIGNHEIARSALLEGC
jgi:hypothetical protein